MLAFLSLFVDTLFGAEDELTDVGLVDNLVLVDRLADVGISDRLADGVAGRLADGVAGRLADVEGFWTDLRTDLRTDLQTDSLTGHCGSN